MTCILITSLMPRVDESRVSPASLFDCKNMLIIAKGDISMSHHFFNLGEEMSWQISRLRCWNGSLGAVIDETKKPQALELVTIGSPCPTSLMVVSFTCPSDLNSPPVTVTPSYDSDVVSYCSDSTNFQLELDNGMLTARFRLLLNGTKIKEICSSFEDYQVSWSWILYPLLLHDSY